MNIAMSYKILFLEDNETDVEFMKWELDRAGFKSIPLQVSTKHDFLDAIASFKPDIILADYALPMFNGMHAYRLFKDLDLMIPFILVTGSISEKVAQEFQDEGVDDLIMKSSFDRLHEVLTRQLKMKEVERQKRKIMEELDRKNAEVKQLREDAEKTKAREMLSSREFEILCLIASGKAVKEIADQLSLSPSTIATYRARLMEKLELKSNVELAQYAIRNNLVK